MDTVKLWGPELLIFAMKDYHNNQYTIQMLSDGVF